MLDALVFFLGPVLVFWGVIAIFFTLLYAFKLMTKERAWINFWLATLLLSVVTIYRAISILSVSDIVPLVAVVVLLAAYFACAYWFSLITKERAWVNFWIVFIALIFFVLLRIVEYAYLDVATRFVALPQ